MSDGHWSPGPQIADGAAEDAQADTEHGHVAEIECSLEQSVHSEQRTRVRSDYSHVAGRLAHAILRIYLVLKKK